MTRGWGRSLSFKIAIGAVVLFALFSCVQSVSATGIEVKPPSIDVSFSFDQPIGSKDYSTDEYFTITISGNATLNIEPISADNDRIRITPYPSSFTLKDGESRSIKLTIWASSYASEGTHTEEIAIKSNGEIKKIVMVTITITYYAKIEVSRSSIDFGRVHRTDNPSEKVMISEVYGYKTVDIGARITGNSWLTATLTGQTVKKGSPVTITFQLNPGQHPDHNRYSWTFSLSSTTSHTTISQSSLHIEAYILMPPKLGKLYDEDLEIKFDKPKGTVSRYDRYIDVCVRNEGDETMYLSSSVSESLGGGIILRIDHSPPKVSGKSSENIRLHVIAPYDAPEGTYHGRLYIDAGEAGHGYVDITVKIIWPVDLIISSSSPYFTPSPPSIDFGSLALKERGYEKKSVNITLTERYGYKPVRNLRFSTRGEYGKWLHDNKEFNEIPPGESRSFILKIEPGLEAVPKSYSWKYDISASEISRKRIEVKANIVPLNIPEMIEYLKSFRESILYKRYPSSEVIISNGMEMLEVVERSDIGAEDWKKIPVLMKGTLSLLSSLNDGLISSEGENYGKAVENLVSASVSTSTIESNSELNNWDIYGYAKEISAGADRTTEEVLMDEAKKLELRGWNIKKAVEHAMAMDAISGLKEEENVLESALSYQYAATIYGLLDNKEKRLECTYEESLLMDKHDELVSDATDLRIRAEGNISISKENDLVRIGDVYFLVNPYKFDTFSANYGSAKANLEDAASKYKVAGELLMSENTKADLNELRGEWSHILSMFFLACILYCAAFIYTINRIIMGTAAYMMDMHEREVGEIVVTTTAAF
jgi:hypothetical protein